MRLIFCLFLAMAGSASAGEKVAFFGMFWIDMSAQAERDGQDPAEAERLKMIEKNVADRFAEEGFELVDLSPAADAIDRHANLAKCYGCDSRIAGELGADYSLVGEVQKTSNAILAMNLQLRDAESGALVKGGVVDIRGNTDETWQRGIRYILKNRIFVDQ